MVEIDVPKGRYCFRRTRKFIHTQKTCIYNGLCPFEPTEIKERETKLTKKYCFVKKFCACLTAAQAKEKGK
jgi:hypothetical protein